MLSNEECYRAVKDRDIRFDGLFITGVITTGIYCRPSCPARTPYKRNMRFFQTPAAAQSEGFRACKRCSPGTAPGSPEWNLRSDIVGRAKRLIDDGFIERGGVKGLRLHLGQGDDSLQRQLIAELGADPLAMAVAQRVETARLLIERTDLPLIKVAVAAGFSSPQQLTNAMQRIFTEAPLAIRQRSRQQHDHVCSPGSLQLQLAYRAPFDIDGLFEFLAVRAVPGLEEADQTSYRRVLRLPHGFGLLTLSPGDIHSDRPFIQADLQLDDLRDLTGALARCRRTCDLDADPMAIMSGLREDQILGPLIKARPGLRVPGHVDAHELAIRAVLGQQVSVAAARKHTADLVAQYGEPLATPIGSITHAFPSSEQLADLETVELGMPLSRRETILHLARALSAGQIDLTPGADRDDAVNSLERVPGIGPWTSSYIRMRGLADPDVFLANDIAIRRALIRLGVSGDPRSALALAAAWRPWRSYGLMHLWHLPK